jgi:hypothetical protein
VYLSFYAKVGLTFSPSRAGEFPLAPVAGNIVLRGWLTGIFGGPLHWWFLGHPGASATPPDVLVAVCGLLLFLFLRELRRTRSRSFRALWLPGFFLACNVVLVVAGRASYVGALIALDYRYQGELGAVTAVALGCATLPLLGALESAQPRRPSELLDVPARVVVAVSLICVLGLVSSTQYALHWQSGDVSKRYFAALLGDISRLHARTEMIDGTVPGGIMWAAGYPMNTHSHLLPQFASRLSFVTTSTDQLHMVDGRGHIRPVAIAPTRTALPGRGACGYEVRDDEVRIPLSGPLLYGGWWVRLGYVSTGDSPVTVRAGGKSHRTTIKSGLHSLYFKAGEENFDSITISGLQGDATLCTDDITVGRPEPVRAGPS